MYKNGSAASLKISLFITLVLAIIVGFFSVTGKINKVEAWTETDLPYKSGTIAGFYHDGDIDFPVDLAHDSQGNIYVVEDDNHRISKFNSNGVFISNFAGYGTGNGELEYPMGIDIDNNDNVYVADSVNGRIVEYNSSGTFIRNFGSKGSGDGQFVYPYDVVVDADGNLFVTDFSLNRVQKLNSSGVFQWKSGTTGTGNGQLRNPYKIDMMSNGNLVIADTTNSRIQIWNSSGVYQSQFGSSGVADGQFGYPKTVMVDSEDNIYVGDIDLSVGNNTNTRVQIFNSAGVFQRKFGSYGVADGQFGTVFGITVNNTLGRIYVGDATYNRIQVFNLSGEFQSKFGSNYWSVDKIGVMSGVAVDHNGFIYVADQSILSGIEVAVIKKYNSAGEYISSIGSYGIGDGKFLSPQGIAVDANNNLYVTGGVALSERTQLQKFNSSGALVMTIESPASGPGSFTSGMIDVAIDGNNGDIFISENTGIKKFSSTGTYITECGYGSYPSGVFGITVAGNGDLYVADASANQIDVYSSQCVFKFSFGSSGAGNGQFSYPTDVEIDNNNKVYVVDNFNYRLQKFELDGTFILAYGREGVGDGMFIYPEYIAIGDDNTVYVTDYFMSNVQQLFFDRVPPSGSIALAQGSSYVADPTVNVIITSQDNESGTAQMMISTSLDFAGASWEAYSTQKIVDVGWGDGIKNIYAKFKDNRGNESDVKGVSVVLDESAPVVSAKLTTNSNGSKTAKATAVDSAAGVNKVYCSFKNSGYTAVSGNTCSKTFTSSGSFWYYACDNASHCSAHQEMKVTVTKTATTTDNQDPSPDNLSPNEEDSKTYFTLLILGEDGAPIKEEQLEIGGATYQTDGSGKMNIALNKGSNTIIITYKGNEYRQTVVLTLGTTTELSLSEKNRVKEDGKTPATDYDKKENNIKKGFQSKYLFLSLIPIIIAVVLYLVSRRKKKD